MSEKLLRSILPVKVIESLRQTYVNQSSKSSRESVNSCNKSQRSDLNSGFGSQSYSVSNSSSGSNSSSDSSSCTNKNSNSSSSSSSNSHTNSSSNSTSSSQSNNTSSYTYSNYSKSVSNQSYSSDMKMDNQMSTFRCVAEKLLTVSPVHNNNPHISPNVLLPYSSRESSNLAYEIGNQNSEIFDYPTRKNLVIKESDASILFADVVGFTNISATLPAETLVIIFIFIFIF